MNLKLFELRDSLTFIPIFAFRCQSEQVWSVDQWLFQRAGFGLGSPLVIVGRLGSNDPFYAQCTHDPRCHMGSRTFGVAHQYIQEHFDELESGAVIDVEFILGITTEPKKSERLTNG
jgi:hypothetical protein